jgi:hypothetical protein
MCTGHGYLARLTRLVKKTMREWVIKHMKMRSCPCYLCPLCGVTRIFSCIKHPTVPRISQFRAVLKCRRTVTCEVVVAAFLAFLLRFSIARSLFGLQNLTSVGRRGACSELESSAHRHARTVNSKATRSVFASHTHSFLKSRTYPSVLQRSGYPDEK